MQPSFYMFREVLFFNQRAAMPSLFHILVVVSILLELVELAQRQELLSL